MDYTIYSEVMGVTGTVPEQAAGAATAALHAAALAAQHTTAPLPAGDQAGAAETIAAVTISLAMTLHSSAGHATGAELATARRALTDAAAAVYRARERAATAARALPPAPPAPPGPVQAALLRAASHAAELERAVAGQPTTTSTTARVCEELNVALANLGTLLTAPALGILGLTPAASDTRAARRHLAAAATALRQAAAGEVMQA